jgi:DNA-directed RNA polymerase specialized sigma24 family protein
MMLRFIEGKSMNEIGKLEGISSQAAGRAIRAGVKRAKKTIAKEDF